MSSKDEGSNRRKKKRITPEQVQELLDSVYKSALTGIPGFSRTVTELAEDYARQYPNDKKRAAKELVKSQVTKSGAAGFITGLGGLITLPVTLPADVITVLAIQLRMIAAVAQIGGFDPESDQVQTFSFACLVKGGVADVLKSAGIKVGTNLAKGAIAKIPGYVIANINKKIGFQLVTRFGGSRLGKQAIINFGKMVPVVGGVIGGGFDVAITNAAGARAITLFIDQQIPDAKSESVEAEYVTVETDVE